MRSGCLNIDSHFPWSPDISVNEDPSLALIIAVNQDQIVVVFLDADDASSVEVLILPDLNNRSWSNFLSTGYQKKLESFCFLHLKEGQKKRMMDCMER